MLLLAENGKLERCEGQAFAALSPVFDFFEMLGFSTDPLFYKPITKELIDISISIVSYR